MAISEQATEWYVENRGGPLDREARTRFMAWLQASPVHVGEYLAIAALARDLDTAANRAEIPLELLLDARTCAARPSGHVGIFGAWPRAAHFSSALDAPLAVCRGRRARMPRANRAVVDARR